MLASKLLAGALVSLLAAAPAGAAPAPRGGSSGANPYLNAGIRLYNELEFAAALEQLKKAESFAGNSLADEVLIHVYEGIVEYESNHRDAAETEFKTALALNIKAQLPRKMSPKIVALFEKVRTELAASQPETPPVPPVADVPAAAPKAPPPSPAPSPAPQLALTTPPPEKKGGSVAPWIALGTGVAAAAAGGVLAYRAHSLSESARTDTFQNDAQAHLSSARSSQTAAYICLGAATVAAATFVALYVMDRPAESP